MNKSNQTDDVQPIGTIPASSINLYISLAIRLMEEHRNCPGSDRASRIADAISLLESEWPEFKTIADSIVTS